MYERDDEENPFDELKNQWSWACFTSRKLRVSQISAWLIALVYNWWSLYARLIEPAQHHEAVRNRRRLLGRVAALRPCIERAVRFMQTLRATAKQLEGSEALETDLAPPLRRPDAGRQPGTARSRQHLSRFARDSGP